MLDMVKPKSPGMKPFVCHVLRFVTTYVSPSNRKLRPVYGRVRNVTSTQFSLCYIFLFDVKQCTSCPGGGGGATKRSVILGGSAPRSNPLPFHIPFWQKRYPFYTCILFIEKKYPFHVPTLGSLVLIFM